MKGGDMKESSVAMDLEKDVEDKDMDMETARPPKNKFLLALDNFNDYMTFGPVGRYFEIKERNSSFLQELRAGIVAFLTVCYIIPVNAGILSDTGGTCVPANDCCADRYNISGNACKFDDAITNPCWANCIAELKRNLIAATCIAAMIGTFGMAIIARMPLAVAPAMGVNAYFTYTVVGYMGTGRISYQAALAAAFVEGLIFIFLSVTGVRARFVELIPKSLMYATAVGIGAFLCFIGLQQSEGLGVITYDGATLVALGACPPEERGYTYMMRGWDAYWHDFCWTAYQQNQTVNDLTCGTCAQAATYFASLNPPVYPPINAVEQCMYQIAPAPWIPTAPTAPDIALGLPPRSANYGCMGKVLQSATTWLGIFGGALMALCLVRGVKASILIGILFVTFISWIPTHGNKATYFKYWSSIPGGQERYEYFLKGGTVPSVTNHPATGGQLHFSALSNGDTWIALITFLYLDFMDATSTMYAMARLVDEKVPGFLNAKGQWPRQMFTMAMDGLSIVVGSTLGTSPLTVFAESSVGIREGGRTGITSLIIAVGFGISMFLSPIFASIPPYATGPAIVIVGALMFEHCRHVDWLDAKAGIPAFLTIILMPLTYSIAYGIIGGILSHMFLWLACFILDVFDSLVFKTKPVYHVWLNEMSQWYIVFGQEQILVDQLPGYKAQETHDHHDATPMSPDAYDPTGVAAKAEPK